MGPPVPAEEPIEGPAEEAAPALQPSDDQLDIFG
jgi:hypothetical protein